MAELILAIVGLAITVPGVAIAFAQAGSGIKTLATKFANAPEAIQQIGAFGHDLHVGKLKLDLELAEWAFSIENLDTFVKDAVEDILDQLRIALIGAAATLDGLFDKKGHVKRARFVVFGERKAKHALNELKRWQGDFESIIDLIDKKRRLVPDNLLLTREKLRIIHKANDQDYTPINGSSLVMADCEYLDHGIQTIKVLIEQKVMPEDVDVGEIEALGSILASRLWSNTARQGILPCLGYRRKKNYELVFKLPEQIRSAQTLRAVISKSNAKVDGVGCPLQERITLGRELCDAVLCVHTSDLVHKNIRPDTVLLVQKASDAQGALGSAYLTNWFMLRKATELSSRRGSNNWLEDFYRHPSRQGQQPEERYNMGHDIYSLGVLLIEISLWESFVQPSRNPPVSELFEKRARNLNLLGASQSNLLAMLTMPLVIYKTLVNLAETEIAPRMGTSFADFVLACLTCLDDKVNGLKQQDLRTSPGMTAMKFREMIIQTFQTMPTS